MVAKTQTGKQFEKLGSSLKGLAENVAGAFSKTAKSETGFAKAGVSAGKMIDRTASWAVGAARLPVQVVGHLFKRYPRLSVFGTVAGGAMAVGGLLHNRAEARSQQEMAYNAAAAQINTGPVYQISPEEYAAMQARMRDGGQQGGFAQNVQQQRSAADGAITTPTL